MQLVSFSCNLYSLVVSEINLQAVNLFVGRNGNGKSTVLHCIEWLADIISEKNWHPVVRNWEANFKDSEGNVLTYSFGWADHGISISHEKLFLKRKDLEKEIVLIERNRDACSVYSSVTENREEINPPETKLVINIRRDIKIYPEFEKLIQWAEATYSFRFGTIVPEIVDINRKLSETNFSPLQAGKTEYSLGELFDGLTPDQQGNILQLMQAFEYTIETLKVGGPANARSLFYTEKGVPGEFDITTTSQGTFRAFTLLLYFFRLLNTQKTQLFLIDDLGEGLDYSRAYELGKYIFKACEESGVQLIATSNDSFLMNAVDIDYWNLLRRDGSKITAINKENSKSLFDDFGYSGLSNFYFLSSDFIDSYQE